MGGAFVATRHSDAVNRGRPTVQRRWVEAATGELVITQDWGASKIFTARYKKPAA